MWSWHVKVVVALPKVFSYVGGVVGGSGS